MRSCFVHSTLRVPEYDMPTPIRPNVLLMTPYSPGKPIEEVKRELGLASVVKLASNENPLGPSPKALDAIRRAVGELHIYPDGATFKLKQAISKKFRVPTEKILLGNGSDELIHLLGLIYLGNEEDEVIVGDPSFIRYDATAELAACKLVRVPLDEELRFDVDAMLAAVTDKTRLIFLANPNNPTGTMTPKEAVDRLVERIPEHVTLVLDEAYWEFAAHEPSYSTSLRYLDSGKNVIGLRTFSKAYGLAGIRVGYGFAPAAVVDAVNRAREPFNVNSLAQVAAEAALEDAEHLERTLENNRKGMETIGTALRRHGAKVYPSYANFVFADLGRPTRPLFQAIMEKGVIIRPGDIFGAPTFLRVSIGTEKENETFVQVLDAVLS